jgi:putative sigma-54 modulation protein
VIDKLTRQAQHQLGKWRGRKRRAAGRTPALWSGVLAANDARESGRPRVIRTRRFVAKPMTVDEAILEVGTSEEGLVVYRDAETERVSVLYRRKDGHLGLIEPEA